MAINLITGYEIKNTIINKHGKCYPKAKIINNSYNIDYNLLKNRNFIEEIDFYQK